jgi:tetratricopeptide (TPR) repeat protein
MRRALLALVLVLAPAFARADTPPNTWEVAKDPGARDRWRLHVRVSQLLAEHIEMPGLRSSPLEQARALLEAAHARESPDVRLRFDLGRVYEALHSHAEAIAVLQPAVDAEPDHAGAVDALRSLAYAYAKLDKPREERLIYKRFLTKVMSDSERATATLNLAEAEMRLVGIGDSAATMIDSVAHYREAADTAAHLPNTPSANNTYALALWGLVVSLDRSGDPQGAAQEAKLANQLDPDQRLIGNDSPDSPVFFEPRYERLFYTALGAQEAAKASVEPRQQLERWKRAFDRWSAYVREAERLEPNVKWLALARAHRDAAKKQMDAAAKRVKALPPRSPSLIDIDE